MTCFGSVISGACLSACLAVGAGPCWEVSVLFHVDFSMRTLHLGCLSFLTDGGWAPGVSIPGERQTEVTSPFGLGLESHTALFLQLVFPSIC